MDDRRYPFLDDVLERSMKEYYNVTGESDLSNVWHHYRGFDGETEYIAADLILFQVFQYLQMVGRVYESEVDDTMPDYPTTHYLLEWRHNEKHTSARTLPNAKFWDHKPNILHNFESAIHTLNLGRVNVTITSNLKDTLFAMWIADVNGHRAGGNGAAEAVTHAWGISVGIWQPDELAPPADQPPRGEE